MSSALCKWCGKQRDFSDWGKLCARCRKRQEAGGTKPKTDAMDRRLPGSFEMGKRR